jgi:hypothetical protein
MKKTKLDQAKAHCGNCIYFENDPAVLERTWSGLASMSSGFASVRALDGLCSRHGLYLSYWDGCHRFMPRSLPGCGQTDLGDVQSLQDIQHVDDMLVVRFVCSFNND